MDKKKILLKLFDEKILRILEYIIYSNDDLNLSKISKQTNVSNASTHRILKRLETL
ncbi:MAG: helix-turn-helix domain-containing protein, partial [Candidatus Woesearchaeota archaeon]